MAMEMVVGPARSAADRRPPEWLAKDAADHSAGYGADRTGDNEARPRSCSGADPIGPGIRCDHH